MRPYDKYVLAAVCVVGLVAVLLAVLPLPPRFPGDTWHYGRVVLPGDLYVGDADVRQRARQWIKDNPTPENIAHLVAALDEKTKYLGGSPVFPGGDLVAFTLLRDIGEPARYVIYASLRDICVERISAAKSKGWDYIPLDRAILMRLRALPDEDPLPVRLAGLGVIRGRLGFISYNAITPASRKETVESILKTTNELLVNLQSGVLPPRGKTSNDRQRPR